MNIVKMDRPIKLEDIKEVDEIEEILDILTGTINKYSGTEEEKELHKHYIHIKVRFCKYQVEHYQLTGQYYLLDRLNIKVHDLN